MSPPDTSEEGSNGFIRVAPNMNKAERYSPPPNGHRTGSPVCASAGPTVRPDRMVRGNQRGKGVCPAARQDRCSHARGPPLRSAGVGPLGAGKYPIQRPSQCIIILHLAEGDFPRALGAATAIQ